MTRTLLLSALLLAACGPNRTIPDRTAYQPPQAQQLDCVPNLDGQIDENELQAATGVPVSYLVSPAGMERTVDLAGAVDASGHLVWDFATDYADDQVASLTAQPLAGRWYAGSFGGGQFVAPLDAGGTLEGVYQHTSAELLFLGYASKEEAPAGGKTLVVYQSPISLYRFPIQPGQQWISASDVRNATVRGLPYAGRDVYDFKVDAAGALQLPDVTFTQAMRVRTTLTASPAAGAPVTRRQVGFVFECFGEVARATSRDGETQDDFTQAAELRRLGF